jgi:hypothetical protein
MDPIIAATWSDDGAVSDVCKALIPRIREPNHIVRGQPHSIFLCKSECGVIGRLQSAHCASHNDQERLNRQRAFIPLASGYPKAQAYFDCQLGR